MPSHPIKTRLLGYRVLCMLLYESGKYPFVKENVDGSLTILTGPLSRHLQKDLGRVRQQFPWFEESGFTQWMVMDKGVVHLKLNYPQPPQSAIGVKGAFSAATAGSEQ